MATDDPVFFELGGEHGALLSAERFQSEICPHREALQITRLPRLSRWCGLTPLRWRLASSSSWSSPSRRGPRPSAAGAIGVGEAGVGVLTSQMFPGRWELMCCLVRVVDADVNMPHKLRIEKHLFNELTFPGSFPKIV